MTEARCKQATDAFDDDFDDSTFDVDIDEFENTRQSRSENDRRDRRSTRGRALSGGDCGQKDERLVKREYAAPVRTRTPDLPMVEMPAFLRMAIWFALAVMAVLASFLFISGTMTVGSAAEYTKSFMSDFEMTVYNLKSDSLMAADVTALSKIYYIPWNDTAAEVNPDNITRVESVTHSDRESTGYAYEELYYEDETITVHYWRERLMIYKKMLCTVHFAEVQISHPTQLRTAFAGGEYHDMASRAEEYPEEMAQDANAVIAVNGDFYNYRETGVLIRNNTSYRFKPYGKLSWDVLLIDDAGNFHIQSDKKLDLTRLQEERIYVEDGVEYNIVNTLHFGPSLVVNGEYKIISASSGCGSEFNFDEGRSRTAIGQLGELHYLLCVVEETNAVRPISYGTTLDQVGKLMLERGCQQAYTLDGGQSSVMIFDGKTLNNIYRGDARKLTDLVYFASALPAGE